MKKISVFIVLTLIINSLTSIAFASENHYAITSSLNSGWNCSDVGRTLVAYADFGSKPEFNGMRAEIGDDSSTVEVSRVMGKEGWTITPNKGTKARYINIDVDDKLIYDVEDGQSFVLEVEYYDNDDISSLAMVCDSMDYYPAVYVETSNNTSQSPLNDDSAVYEGEYLELKNTGIWQKYNWFLPNPKFTNKLDGFDIRVGIYSESMMYSRGGEVNISGVKLYRLDTKSRISITSNTDDHFGNIFFKGEKVVLKTNFEASLYPYFSEMDKEYDIDTVYTVIDEKGDVVYRKTDKFVLPKAECIERTIEVPIDKYGIYRYDVEVFCVDKKIYSMMGGEFSYVNSSMGEEVNEKAGIQIGLVNVNDEKTARLARYAGFAHARMMAYYYSFRKSAQQYEVTNVAIPESYKSLYRSFKKAGMTVDVNLHSASWMGTAYNFSPIERTPPYTENGLRRWADYCARMAELLGDTVDYFEIWNEYNLGPNHSFNKENRPASDYAKMYEVSKEAINKVNPDIPVLAFNTSGAGSVWIDDALKTGLKDIDIISIHPYQWYGDPLTFDPIAPIKRVEDVKYKYGLDDVPIWITEYGYSSRYEDVNSDMEQAMYNAQAYALIMATGMVERYYAFCLLDKANNLRADRESNFGLLRCDVNNPIPYLQPYAAKPAYLVMSFLNHMYADAEPVDQIKIGDTGVVIRSKHKNSNNQFAIMFSNKNDGDMITLDLGTDEITFYDAYGNAEKRRSTSGIYSFDMTENVTYIEGDFKRFNRVVGGAYPTDTGVTMLYGEAAKVSISNYSGNPVTAKVYPMPGSKIEATEKVIDGENGYLELKGGDIVAGNERVNLVISDGYNTYYDGYININFKPKASIITTLVPQSDGWSLRCTVTNLSNINDLSGRLSLLTPEEWKSSIEDSSLVLKPNETQVVDLRLPIGEVADERLIEVGFIVDENTKIGSYISKTYNFSAAIYANEKITIDGKADEWKSGFINLNRNEQFTSLLSLGNPYAGPDDLSGKLAIMWDEDNFYLFTDVYDNIHFSTGVTPVNIWQMDSIQFALVYDPEDLLGKQEFEEFAIGEIDGKSIIYRHKTRFTGDGNYNEVEGSEVAVVNEGMHTYYEVKIPWSSLMPEKLDVQPGTELKFSMLINENDGVGRVGYMSFGDGIASSKNSVLFKRLYIRK